MGAWEDSAVVKLDEVSLLKAELNRGIASLAQAREQWHRPQLCLNRSDGMEVIRKITADDRANTEIHLSHLLGNDGNRLWLNLRFWVFLDKCSSDSDVALTPRQTSYIVRNLPPEFQQAVFGRVRVWYDAVFKDFIRGALARIEQQFEEGKWLAQGTHNNVVFDIHDEEGRGHDAIPYTEFMVLGQDLPMVPSIFGFHQDYGRANTLLRGMPW